MRGRGGYMTLKGKQFQISLYLPPEQYWLLRATSKRTGFSMQYLLRKAQKATDPPDTTTERTA